MGHLLTPHCLRPDCEKIQVILQMSELKDVTAIPWDGDLSCKFYASPITDDRATKTPREHGYGIPVVATALPDYEHNQEVSDGSTCSSLL